MDTKALRQKVLDLAIRGKLVPQDPNDEPASVLLERIRAEKQRLVKEGKLKAKDIKNDTIIFVGDDNLHYEKFADGSVKCIEDEIPFELPDGWAWSKIGPLCEYITSGSRGWAQYYSDTGSLFLRMGNLSRDSFELRMDNLQRVNLPENAEGVRTRVAENDLLFSITAEIGMLGLIPANFEEAYINQHVGLIRFIREAQTKYFPYILMSDFCRGQYYTTQSGMKNSFRLDNIQNILIPVPPLKEQVRIAEKLGSIWPRFQLIDTESVTISDVISQTKSKILNLAIRGMLVPQNPDDEPASTLLDRIRTEKEELIRQGKIKRDKKESIIFRGDDNSYYESVDGTAVSIENDIPFDLPNNWTWCRIRNIASVRGGKRLPKGADFSDTPTTHAYIRVTDMKNRTINDAELKYISDDVYEQIKAYTISSKDLYVTIAGTIGVVGEVPDKLDGMNLTENAVKVCDITINKKYLCYILLSSFVQQQFQDKTHQVAMPKLALERILTTLIPLPPLKEQEQIVEIIDKSVSWLDGIQTLLV